MSTDFLPFSVPVAVHSMLIKLSVKCLLLGCREVNIRRRKKKIQEIIKGSINQVDPPKRNKVTIMFYCQYMKIVINIC